MANEINISNISLQKSTEILLSGSRYIILMTCFLATLELSAQSDLNLQDVVVGKVEVSATHSITLGPGFHAKEGSSFHAFIGSVSQPQNSTTTISSPSANATPAAGSSGNNYIKSITYREAKTTIPTGSFEHLEEIQYFDGLGRPIQTIMVGASPLGQDIIKPFLYDGFGREAIKTLPYIAAKSGDFRTGVTESTVNSFYSSNPPTGVISDSRAYTKFDFDNSPLNRVVSQTGPGSDWETNSKKISTNYLSNTTTKPGWSVTSNYSYSSFTYAANTLYVTETIDEDGHYSREYKDKLGQVVLKESQSGSYWLQTFYIYDDFGLLRCVMPPEATNPNTETDLCYYYLYDNRKRLTEKKLPGGGTIKMVYDARDRLRSTQNSLQAPNNEWTFTKYDELNRSVITGTIINSGNIQSAIDVAPMNETHNNPTYYGYDNNSYPTSGATILTATYYDHYDFISVMNLSDSLHSYTFDSGNYNFASITDQEPKGYVTGMMSKVMYSSADNGSVPKSELFTATYYDKYGHVLRSISENQLKGKDVVSNLYQDITYLILQTKQEHHKESENITIEKWFEYDHTGRILATREKFNDQPEITSSAMKYNEIGEMTAKYLHSYQTSGTRTFIQEMNYQYNIRGWLTKINDPGLGENNDMFGLQLFYNTTTEMGSLSPGQGLYSGNIVGMKWGTKNEAIKGYQFSYDNLNRILQGNYAEGSSLNSNPGYYSETVGSYDKNGNILGLQRKYNDTIVDNLTYIYPTKSNKLLRVTDSGTSSSMVDDYPSTSQDYTYDASGNMTYDGGKNLNIEYQKILNLPLSLNGQSRDLYYRYDATGRKLQKRIEPTSGTGTTINYIGNIVYEGGSISYILTDNGRLIPEGTGSNRKFLYEYSMKDHLGNNRVTFMGTDLGGAVDIVQTISYYPFGLVMSQMNGNTATGYTKNKYLYNGKELQSDNMTGEALNWYDYGARFYDPQIGRWNTQDPMSMIYPDFSPYSYAHDNPVVFNDPNGMDVVNGFKDEWENKKAKREQVSKNLENTRKNGNEKQIKKAEHAYNKADRQFNRVDKNYQATEKLIGELKSNAPVLFNIADNLKDPGGNEVDVVVRIADGSDFSTMEGNSDVEKQLGMGTEGEGIILGEGRRRADGTLDLQRSGSTPYLPISSYDRMGFTGDGNNKVSVYMRIGKTADWLAHEFGHAIYLSNSLLQYYYWIKDNSGSYQAGGHGNGDPNGQYANNVQEKYKKGAYK